MAWAHARGFVMRQALAVLVVAVTAAIPMGAAQAPSPGTRADENAIKAVIAATTDALLVKHQGTWLITAFHNTILQK